ncbi:MAG: FAD-dependent oxidoreductase [Alicyclobacillus sp.]|nr:FAD-dependent oxidoreductase [Alicyclobacillus sp.]
MGAWAPPLLSGAALEVERQVLFRFDSKDAALSRSPIYIFEEEDGTQFYGFPELASEGAKVAFHHGGEICTPETLDRQVKPEEVERMRDFLKRRIPGLADGTLLRSSTCMYTNTPDLHFVVGEHPSEQNVILGLGYSGHGFKFASVMGEILVGLAQGERTIQLSDILSPNRPAMRMQHEWTHKSVAVIRYSDIITNPPARPRRPQYISIQM